MKYGIALIALLAMAMPSAQAFDRAKVIHATYHYIVHEPVQVLTFIYHAPVIAVRWADSKLDMYLANRAGYTDDTL